MLEYRRNYKILKLILRQSYEYTVSHRITVKVSKKFKIKLLQLIVLMSRYRITKTKSNSYSEGLYHSYKDSRPHDDLQIRRNLIEGFSDLLITSLKKVQSQTRTKAIEYSTKKVQYLLWKKI